MIVLLSGVLIKMGELWKFWCFLAILDELNCTTQSSFCFRWNRFLLLRGVQSKSWWVRHFCCFFAQYLEETNGSQSLFWCMSYIIGLSNMRPLRPSWCTLEMNLIFQSPFTFSSCIIVFLWGVSSKIIPQQPIRFIEELKSVSDHSWLSCWDVFCRRRSNFWHLGASLAHFVSDHAWLSFWEVFVEKLANLGHLCYS